MDPFTLALLGMGAAKAVGGIAQGVGTAQAAKAKQLTPQQQAELRRLRARQRGGGLGLTAEEEARMRRQAEGAQMAVTRDLEAMALQQAAAQQAGGRAVMGRDIFLQEQAEQQTLRSLQQQEEQSIREADTAERQAERAEIAALQMQSQQAEAQRRAGIAQAVSLGLAGAADVGMQAVDMKHAAQMQDAAIAKLSERSTVYGFQPQPIGRAYGGLVPVPIGAQ